MPIVVLVEGVAIILANTYTELCFKYASYSKAIRYGKIKAILGDLTSKT